eukprot:TRINITY_DN1071_c0_g1_i2.p1 TRINITY_DN1071_c0_g1~~TRINITY_DN1071_c0_g1_i2.p1  ORF type:complete len:1587 (-),score=484.22 TRINITY_DN1071_c0_g1_i2:1088-5848(-)
MRRDLSSSKPKMGWMLILLLIMAFVPSSSEVINMISVHRDSDQKNVFDDKTEILEGATVSPTVITNENIYDLHIPSEENNESKRRRKINLPPHISLSTTYLNFEHRPTTMSSVQTIDVKNNDQSELTLSLVSCDNPSFKVSVKSLTVPPHSTAEIAIQFQPREIDCTEGNLTITTNRGGFIIPMKGCGIFSPYKLPSLLRMKLMPDWTYNQPLTIHNPFNQMLEIHEVHTTGNFLRLSLPIGSITESNCPKTSSADPSLSMADNTNCGQFAKPTNWTVPPWEMKLFILVSFQAQSVGEFFGSVHIKTNLHTLVIPVEITVVKDVVIPLPAELGFNVITSFNQTVFGNYSILNSGKNYVKLTKLVHVQGHHEYVTPVCQFHYTPGKVLQPTSQNMVIGVSCSCKNHTSLDQFPAGFVTIRGKIALHTNHSTVPIELFYKIKVIIGRVEYNMNENTFIHQYRDKTKAGWAPINRTLTLTNNFPCALTIYSAQIIDPRFKTIMEKVPTVIGSKSTWTGLSFNYFPNDTSVFTVPLMIITNLSIVSVPMRVTHGYLTPLNTTNINVGVVAQSERPRVVVSLFNENKLTIPVWCVVRSGKISTEVRLASLHVPSEMTFPTPNKIVFKTQEECNASQARNDAIIEIPQYGSVGLSIELPSGKEGHRMEQFKIVTPLEEIPFNITYKVVAGGIYFVNQHTKNLEVNPEVTIRDPVCLGQKVSFSISMISTFEFPIKINGLISTNPMFYATLTNHNLLPNRNTFIGKVMVEPRRHPAIKHLLMDTFENQTKSLRQLYNEAKTVQQMHASISGMVTKVSLEFQTDTSIRIPMRIQASFMSPPLFQEGTTVFPKMIRPNSHAFAPIYAHNPTMNDMRFAILPGYLLPVMNRSRAFGIYEKAGGNKLEFGTLTVTVPPKEVAILAYVKFSPLYTGSYRYTLMIKNELTLLEVYKITAESSRQRIGFINPGVHNSLIVNGYANSFGNNIRFVFNPFDLNVCNTVGAKESWFSSLFRKEKAKSLEEIKRRRINRKLEIYNTDKTSVIITQLNVNGTGCRIDGPVSIDDCKPLSLAPREKRAITISIDPTFDSIETVYLLELRDDDGNRVSKHKIRLLIPSDFVSKCSSKSRSFIGFKFYSAIVVLFVCVSTAAFFGIRINKNDPKIKEEKIRVERTNSGDRKRGNLKTGDNLKEEEVKSKLNVKKTPVQLTSSEEKIKTEELKRPKESKKPQRKNSTHEREAEKERMDKLEKERIERERTEKDRIEKERIEREKVEREEEEKREKQRIETERIEKERIEKAKIEKERIEKEKLEKEKAEKERIKSSLLIQKSPSSSPVPTSSPVISSSPVTQPSPTNDSINSSNVQNKEKNLAALQRSKSPPIQRIQKGNHIQRRNSKDNVANSGNSISPASTTPSVTIVEPLHVESPTKPQEQHQRLTKRKPVLSSSVEKMGGSGDSDGGSSLVKQNNRKSLKKGKSAPLLVDNSKEDHPKEGETEKEKTVRFPDSEWREGTGVPAVEPSASSQITPSRSRDKVPARRTRSHDAKEVPMTASNVQLASIPVILPDQEKDTPPKRRERRQKKEQTVLVKDDVKEPKKEQ